jgi:hypothetical protein
MNVLGTSKNTVIVAMSYGEWDIIQKGCGVDCGKYSREGGAIVCIDFLSKMISEYVSFGSLKSDIDKMFKKFRSFSDTIETIMRVS